MILIPEKCRAEKERIDGSKPKILFIPRDQINRFDVKDIAKLDKFVTQRIQNPL